MKKIIAQRTEINGTREVTCAFKYGSIYSTTVTIHPFQGTVKEFFNQNPEDIPSGTIVYTPMSLPRLVKELSTLAVNQADELVVDVQWANSGDAVTVFMQRQCAHQITKNNTQYNTTIPEFGLLTASIFPGHLNLLSLHTHPIIGFKAKLLLSLDALLNMVKEASRVTSINRENMEAITNDLTHLPLLAYFLHVLPSETDISTLSESVTGGPIGPFSSKPIILTKKTPTHLPLETGSLSTFIFLAPFKSDFITFLRNTDTLSGFPEYAKQFQNIFWESLQGKISDKTVKVFAQTISKVMQKGVMEKLVELLNKSDYATKNGLQFTLGLSHKMDLIAPQNPDEHPFTKSRQPSRLDSKIQENQTKIQFAVISTVLIISLILVQINTPTLLHWMMKNGYLDY